MHPLAFISPAIAPFATGVSIVFVVFFFITIWVVLDRVYPEKKGSKKSKEETQQEAQLIQQMHQMLNRMEQRIETLETLVIDKEKEKRSYE